MFPTLPTAAPVDTVALSRAAKDIQEFKNLGTTDAIERVASALVDFGLKLALAIGVFFLGRYIIRCLYRWVHRFMERRQADASLSTFLLSVVKITLYFILIIVVVGILGIETSSFLALFASAGVAVGLALSGTLQNFAGGVLILLLKPYRVGDFIEAQGYSGTVKEIQIFNTIINTPDNKAIIIPNGGLSTGSINNYSLEERRRIDWTVGVAYGTDFDKAKAAILDILKDYKEIETDPAPAVFIAELADSAVNLTVRAWAPSSDYWNVFFSVNERIYRELPQAGIEFPFPQLDVHMCKS